MTLVQAEELCYCSIERLHDLYKTRSEVGMTDALLPPYRQSVRITGEPSPKWPRALPASSTRASWQPSLFISSAMR